MRLLFRLFPRLAVALALAGSARLAAAATPPTSMSLTPGSAVIEVGMDQVYTAELYDSAFHVTAVEPGCEIGFAVDMSSVAGVTIDPVNPFLAHVTGRHVGMSPVRAFYVCNGAQTSVFTAADVTVVPASGTGGASATGGAPGTGGAGGMGGSPVTCPHTLCGGLCVDLAADQNNCGTCGHACSSTQACSTGLCLMKCTAGQVACGAACADTQTDPANCGACGHACDTGLGYSCMAGTCAAVNPCPATAETLCSGLCVNLTTNSQNCGGCGLACDAGEVCVGVVISGSLYPKCATSCGAGALLCGIDCKPANDPKTCGSCDVACGANDVCCSQPLIGSNGSLCGDVSTTLPATAPFACRTCPATTTSCDNKCVDLNSTQQHCGACNTVCQNGCTKGKCDTKEDDGGSCAVGPAQGPTAAHGLIGGLAVLGIAGLRRSRRPRQ